MRSSAYDTSILDPTETIEQKMRDRTTNDTVNIAILNTDYATFYDSAFTTEGQYYTTTDSTITDVPNRVLEPFILKSAFAATLTSPVSYFKKVIFVLDTTFIYSKYKLLNVNSKDLDPNYARWKVDFGDGAGWRNFNPLSKSTFIISYPDTGRYDIQVAIFYCDPYPNCSQSPNKLSVTSIFILNNVDPKLPDLTYEFPNITVGLYKGCGEIIGGNYVPQKPLIIIEGIDIINSVSIPQIFEDYIKLSGSKKLGQLTQYNYDFYVVNFNDTKIDLRYNANGVIALIEFLKGIMQTNEQFVVIGESMGGVIARYALTYMETDAYKNNSNSVKPLQMHNTRLLITNDSPHQGANVPVSLQIYYKNIRSSIAYNVLKPLRWIFPLLDNDIYWNNLLKAKAVKQLLAFHVDANGPHPDRIEFMDELISMNTRTNGYPEFCKLMAFTDGLLSGQSQLRVNNTILQPEDDLIKIEITTKIIIFRFIKIDFYKDILQLKAVNISNPSNNIVESSGEYCKIKIKGCLRKLLRLQYLSFINCAITNHTNNQIFESLDITGNYDTDPAGIFPTLAVLAPGIGHGNFFAFPFEGTRYVDVNTGIVKASITTSRFIPFHYLKTREIETKLTIASLGFGFIPVQSAIDFDYYKTTNTPSNANLLSGNIQTNLFAYTPFDLISGFNYTGNNYPADVDPVAKNLNWSHGHFENTSIDNSRDTGYLCREIGNSKIYINNLDLGTRNADFTFGEIMVGVKNPHYEYTSDSPPYSLPNISYTYSRDKPFKFKEPGVVNMTYEYAYDEGENIVNEGVLNKTKTTIKLCEKSFNRAQNQITLPSIDDQSMINSYPNPFVNYIKIEDLNYSRKYLIHVYDIFGKLVYVKNILEAIDLSIYELESSPAGVYSLYIFEDENLVYRNKFIKLQ